MEFELSEKQKKDQSLFRAFVDQEIIPFAAQFDQDEKISADLIRKMASAGYLGSTLPIEDGGMGIDMVSQGILHEEISRGCSSVRSLLTVHGMVALSILKWGTDEQKKQWLPRLASGEAIGAFGLTEPNIGSDAKSIESTAELVGDMYQLNGSKKWITFGQIADLLLIFAICEGKPSAFLVERNMPGVTIKPISGMLGLRASMGAEIHMKDVLIPKENLVGKVGFGLSHVALSSLDYGRYTVACGCVGVGQAAIEQCLSYVRKRKQFGDPLRKYQLIQRMITEMVVRVKAARLLCQKAGWLRDMNDPDTIMETWVAKYFSSVMINKVTGDAVQIHGANGCSRDYPVERYFRDAKIMEIIEGTTQMHEILIATNEFRHG